MSEFIRARLNLTFLASVLVLIAVPGARARAGEPVGPWEQVSTDDGIVVQRRKVEGSNLKEFQGRGVIDAPLFRVLAVIRDSSKRVEWVSDCIANYTVEEDDVARTQISYQRTHAPWPVSDRDSVNRAEIQIDSARHRVFIPFVGVTHPKVPPVKGVVRMPFVKGHWILTPVDHGKATMAEYQVHADPGGSIPDWLANIASKKLPRDTLAGLRAQVKRRQYPEFEAKLLAAPEAKQMMEGQN